MNVLLIYPKFPDTFWSFKYALKFIRKKAVYPPLGLLTVAAMLPDEFHRRLVDVFIARDSGGDVFVHHSDISEGGYRTLEEGSRVKFTAEQGKKGPQAKDVVVLS